MLKFPAQRHKHARIGFRFANPCNFGNVAVANISCILETSARHSGSKRASERASEHARTHARTQASKQAERAQRGSEGASKQASTRWREHAQSKRACKQASQPAGQPASKKANARISLSPAPPSLSASRPVAALTCRSGIEKAKTPANDSPHRSDHFLKKFT